MAGERNHPRRTILLIGLPQRSPGLMAGESDADGEWGGHLWQPQRSPGLMAGESRQGATGAVRATRAATEPRPDGRGEPQKNAQRPTPTSAPQRSPGLMAGESRMHSG